MLMAASLAKLVAQLESAAARAMQLAQTNVAMSVESLVQEGFDQAVDPYGAAWLPKKSGVGKPLHDKGKLAASFHVTTSQNTITVASSDPRAVWHQKGTGQYGSGQGPYEIRPRKKKALAIPTANAKGWSISLGKSLKALPGRRVHGGKVTGVSLFRRVIHPGVSRRMMLPDPGRLPDPWRATIRRSIDSAVTRAFKSL
jgi:phage gpG-like protein